MTREIKFTSDNTIQYILTRIPEFENAWQEHLKYWKEEKMTIGIDLVAFLDFITNQIEQKKFELLPKTFEIIETLIDCGDNTVRYAATMFFLEGLLNRSSHDLQKLPPRVYIPLLGPKSREFCIENDKFWGGKTLGL